MNAGDLDYVDQMSDEEVKKMSPYVLLMWGATDQASRPIHTLSTAHAVADKVFSLSKHPRLLLKLFVAANGGISKTRYAFRKQKKTSEPNVDMIAKFYQVTPTDAVEYMEILTEEEINQISRLYESKDIK